MLAWLMLACVGTPDDTAVEPTPQERLAQLRAPGPYRAGYREVTVTYDAMLGGEGRQLRTGIWFPTDASSGGEVRYRGTFPAPDVLDDPEPAAGPFPTIAFSHGTGVHAEVSGRIMSHLATHGYVVVAPEHAGDTLLSGDRTTPIYAWRPTDVTAALDHVLTSDLPASEPVGAIGHSFGGYTTHSLAGATYDEALLGECLDGSDTSFYCSEMDADWAGAFRAGFRDERPVAFLTMAPGDWRLHKSGLGAIDRPLLHLSGALDQNVGPDNDPIWQDLPDRDDVVRLHLPNGGHSTFTDAAGVFDTSPGELDAETSFDITRTYALAWMELMVKGDASARAVVEGEVGFTSEVEWVE